MYMYILLKSISSESIGYSTKSALTGLNGIDQTFG